MIVARQLFLVALLVAIVAVATSAQMAVNADTISSAGVFDGQLYKNKAAGFSILLPGGWSVLPEIDNKATFEQGKATTRELSSDLSANDKASVETSLAKTAILFQASSKPTRPGAGRALMSSGVELLIGGRTKEQYIAANKALVLRTPGVRLLNEPRPVTYGPMEFSHFEVEGDANGKPYRQSFIATVHNGRAIFFVVTSLDRSYDMLIDNSLRTFKLVK